MTLRPIQSARRWPHSPWGSLLVRALRHTVVAAAVSLLLGALGCASAPPDEPVAPTVPPETQSDRQSPSDEEHGKIVEEWVTIPIPIFFDAHRSDLDDDDRARLRELQASLSHRSDVIRIRVEGYTLRRDEPESGLAIARANTVIDFLVNDLGMPREMFDPVDRGGEEPLGDIMPSDYPQHRRVEFRALIRRER